MFFFQKKKSPLHINLTSFRAYERAIERIIEGRELFYVIGREEDQIHKGFLIADPRGFAKKLSKAVEKNEHHSRPATPRLVSISGKMRTFYAFAMEDRIIQEVMAETLYKQAAPEFSSKLYSYQKGLSWWDAEISFSRFIRKHNRQHAKNPKNRGLYVFSHDFSQYTDIFPVGDKAPIWNIIKKAYKLDTYSPLPEHLWNLLSGYFRPEVLEKSGSNYCRLFGIPMGSPLCQLLGNLYTGALDDHLEKIEGSFYARYNDDFIFAHSDVNKAKEARKNIDTILKPLGVKLHLEKAQEYFFNPAGRRSEDWPELKGKNTLNYLGYTLTASGFIRLNKKKHRRFLREVRSRSKNMLSFLGKSKQEENGKFLCQAISEGLNPLSLSPFPDAKAILSVVNDLEHLKELDYDIARILAEEITGKKGCKVFREIPYKKMRETWGLMSLFQERHYGKYKV